MAHLPDKKMKKFELQYQLDNKLVQLKDSQAENTIPIVEKKKHESVE